MSKSLQLPMNSYEDEVYLCNTNSTGKSCLMLTNTNGWSTDLKEVAAIREAVLGSLISSEKECPFTLDPV